MNLFSSVTAAAIRKYVYTCFPDLVCNECCYFAFLTNLRLYNCTKIITVTAWGFYSEGGEMYQITLDLEQKPAMLEEIFSF